MKTYIVHEHAVANLNNLGYVYIDKHGKLKGEERDWYIGKGGQSEWNFTSKIEEFQCGQRKGWRQRRFAEQYMKKYSFDPNDKWNVQAEVIEIEIKE